MFFPVRTFELMNCLVD